MNQVGSFKSYLTTLYLDVAKELNLHSEIIDFESNYIRIFDHSKELQLFRGSPSCNDYISTEQHSPISTYLQSIKRHQIPTIDWDWIDLETDPDTSYLKLINKIKRLLPAAITTEDESYTTVVGAESLEEVITELYNLQPAKVGVQRLYDRRYQVLMLGEEILDFVSIKPLSVSGNGQDSIETLVSQSTHHLNLQSLISNDSLFTPEFKEQIPEQNQIAYLESPITGFKGDSRRRSLSELSNQDFEFFKQVSLASRIQLNILNAFKSDDNQWLIHSIKSPSRLLPFIASDASQPDYVIKQILQAYFSDSTSTRPNYIYPKPMEIETKDLSRLPPMTLDFFHVATRFGLTPSAYNNGKLLRIEGQDTVLEMSIRRSPYPQFNCNNASSVVRFKDTTTRILRRNDIPAPKHQLFTVRQLNVDLPSILQYASAHYPVVVKPRAGSSTEGVTTSVYDEKQCIKAIQNAIQFDKNILIEEHIHIADDPIMGGEFRVHVLKGKVIQVVNRIPSFVTGDGVQNIETLIKKKLNNPTPKAVTQFSTLSIEKNSQTAVILKTQKMTFDTIPSEGQRVKIMMFNGEYHNGLAEDYPLGAIHPDNIAMFIAAAQVLNLTWSGIDFLSPDITRSYKEVKCGINEVNNRPSITLAMKLCKTFPERFLNAYFFS